MATGTRRHMAWASSGMVTLALTGCGVVPMGKEPMMSLGAYADRNVSGPVTADGRAFQRINAETPANPPLRIMSANMRVRTMFDGLNNWPQRRDAMVVTVRRFDPDVLGTQECLISQTNDLRDALPEFDYVGVGRDDGGTKGEMCGIFFRRNRFTRLNSGHFWLSTTPEKPGSKSWGEWFPRVVSWVKLRDRHAGGRTFYYFNTHLSHADKGARLESAKLIRQQIDRIAGDDPVIVGGDFNDYETKKVYDVLCNGETGDEDLVLADTFRAAWPERTKHEKTHHSHMGGTEGLRIDWILATSDFNTLAATIDRTNVNGRFPSDHYPVNAVIQWSSGDMVVTAEQ